VHKFWQRADDSSLPSRQSTTPSQTLACSRHSPDRQVKSRRQSEEEEAREVAEEEIEDEEGEEEEKDEGVKERDGSRLPGER
jgi:hypothetical protein